MRTRKTNCPGCKKKLDAATCLHIISEDPTRRNDPEPGDYSVCAYCGQPMRFTKGLRLRAVDRLHLTKLCKRNAQLYLVIDNISSIIQHRNEW